MSQLTKMINHAYNNSLFYQKLKQDSSIESEELPIGELPIVQKQDIFSEAPIETMDYILGRISENEVLHMPTSGSTGICLPVIWHSHDYRRSMTPLWMLRKKYYNISPDDKLCYFYTNRGNEEQGLLYCSGPHELGFSKCMMTEERLCEIYEMMLEYGPKWMLLQPSIAELLLETAIKHGFPPIKELEYIEFSGEMLFEKLRERVEEYFVCKTSNQYGCNEVNSIAYECPYGNMHCVCSNVYVEIVDEQNQVVSDSSEGEIILTSLHNRLMPFVRYRIGDYGRMKRDVRCQCGNHNPVLELTRGRSNDYILTPGGRKVNPYIFVHIIDNINQILDDVIKQCRIIQKDYDYFQIFLRIGDNSVKQEIEELFEKYLIEPEIASARFEFIYSESFLNEDGRKLRYFINDMRAGGNDEKSV